jgi:hypothetical protein
MGGAPPQARIVFEVCVVASNYPDEGRPTGDAGGERPLLPLRTAGASRPAHTEARAELRDRETYYAELRYAVDRQSRSVASAPYAYDGADASARSDEGNRDDNWTRDEMATRAADTWT